MKTLIFFLAVVWAAQAYSWSCDTDVSGLMTDSTARGECMFRMLSHFIEAEEIKMLTEYKDHLSGNQHIRKFSNTNHTNDYIRRIKKYYELRNVVNRQMQWPSKK